MQPKLVYLIIEGPDDERFFDNIVKPLFEQEGLITKCIPHACISRKERIKFIRSIKNFDNQDYIYAKDLDRYPCITSRKCSIIKELNSQVDDSRIMVVAKVIESWYLAGANEKTLKQLRVKRKNIDRITKSTDTIDKIQFDEFFPKTLPRSNIMLKLLESYDIAKAIKCNKSFDYFIRKFLIS
jgi:hypothetical protein